MPKIINKTGEIVKYHPTVIRFTDIQLSRLENIKDFHRVSLNDLVRTMIDSQLSLYEHIIRTLNPS